MIISGIIRQQYYDHGIMPIKKIKVETNHPVPHPLPRPSAFGIFDLLIFD
jgi:hypothetical protein